MKHMVLAAVPGHFDSALTLWAVLQAALTLQALPEHLQTSCGLVVETNHGDSDCELHIVAVLVALAP